MTDKNPNKDIRKLIDKFFEGKTTLQEERRLYEYFNGSEVTDSMMPYRNMMIDLGLLAAGPCPTAGKPKKKLQQFVRYIAAAAALVGILFGGKAIFDTKTERELQALYGGSYVIVNGKRTDDLKKIKQQIEETLAWADKVNRQVDASNMMEDTEQELLNSIDNPHMKNEIEKMLTN